MTAQSEFGALLVMRQAGLAQFTPTGMRAEPALGEHVGVRPVAGVGVGIPLREAIEHVADAHGEFAAGLAREGPAVPVIVGDAPHLRVFGNFSSMLDLGWAGREREHDGAAGFANGFGDLADFSGAVGVVGNAVDFEEVEAP